MTNRFCVVARRLTAVLGAGMLLQASGCALDANALAAQLTLSIAQSVLANLVFGAFNLVP